MSKCEVYGNCKRRSDRPTWQYARTKGRAAGALPAGTHTRRDALPSSPRGAELGEQGEGEGEMSRSDVR